MIINHNLNAMNAHRNMSMNNVASGKSMEKLSSGLRINRAGDDAAGLAISEKMRGQIRGLDQASRNAQDSISLIQTAEGALNETHSILQRMRELAVQSANDTNETTDRTSIQNEMDQLKQEIDRIANNTEFNKKTLLNGSLSKSVSDSGGNAANFVDAGYRTGAATAEGAYTVTFTNAASKGTIDATAASLSATAITTAAVGTTTIGTANAGALTVNGEVITVNATDKLADVVAKINNITSKTGVTASTVAGQLQDGSNTAATALSLTTNAYGTSATVQVSGSGALLDRLGLRSEADTNTVISDAGNDAVATLTDSTGASFTTTQALGNKVTFNNGMVVQGLDGTVAGGNTTTVLVSAGGTLSFQIGANEDQSLDLAINKMDSASLGVASGSGAISVSSYSSAKSAITTINDAINTVSQERAKLGAYQNRLEHTIANLGTSSENLTAAESRVRDVDMAKEMMAFSKNNILSQAAQAMLAQANQQPQGVLQLLR